MVVHIRAASRKGSVNGPFGLLVNIMMHFDLLFDFDRFHRLIHMFGLYPWFS